ncbi:MAG: hypothetical protein WD737_14490 [Gemmatimonadota bacterium]
MRRLLAAVLLVPFVVGCEAEPTTPSLPGPHVGLFTLTTINSEELPVSFEQQDVSWDVIEGFLDINEDATFELEVTYELVEDGQPVIQPDAVGGTYVVEDDVIGFDFGSGTISLVGTLSGDEVSVITEGDTYIFEREG